jgi:alkanesulfonate monooxygenase
MATEFFWQLPVSGDERYADAEKRVRGERKDPDAAYFAPGVSDPIGSRYNYFDYIHQVGKAVELAGFDGVQIPNDPEGEESWIVAGYVTRSTRRIKILAEFDAARGSAVYAAKNAVSYQRFSGGRFSWQIATTSDEKQRRRNGDFIEAADIPARIEEFVTVARNVIAQTNYSFKGRFFEVLEGGFKGPLSGQNVPTVYLQGNTKESYELSAKLADVHVLDGLEVQEAKSAAQHLRALAAAENRLLKVALHLDVIAREIEEEARFDAERYLAQTTNERGSHAQAAIGDTLLWHGLSVRHGAAGSTLVGSYEQITARLVEYAQAGIDVFILGAAPGLEEAYRVGEIVLPEVRSRISGNSQRAA